MAYKPLFYEHSPSGVLTKKETMFVIMACLSLVEIFSQNLNSNCQGNGHCLLEAMSQVLIYINCPGSGSSRCLVCPSSINDRSRYH